MAEAKQPILNGAFYGPSIPPQKSYHRHGRGRGCDCGPCCFLGFLFKLIVSIVIILGIAILVLWLVFRPTKVKFHVVDASLTQFNLTNNNQLGYNLALDINIRNPNRKIGIDYDRIEARAYYGDERFSMVMLSPFYQGHKNTTLLRPVFQGSSSILLGGSELRDYDKEKSDGVFNIDIRLYLRIKFKVGAIKTNRFKPEVKCDLRVPLATNGALTGVFKTKKCDVDLIVR